MITAQASAKADCSSIVFTVSFIDGRWLVTQPIARLMTMKNTNAMIVAPRFPDSSVFASTTARYPVTIFDGIFRIIFTFVIPIAFIAYYPGIVILRPDEIPLLSMLSPVIGIIFFWLSYKFWMLGARRYDGTGS